MRIILGFIALMLAAPSFGQVVFKDTATKQAKTKSKPDFSKLNLANRANDHFMIQFGYDGWMNRPDSIQTTGFGRHFNMYVMLDKPFKTDPRFSVGLGAGVGSSNIYFDQTIVHIANKPTNNRQVVFEDVTDTTQFKKFKLANAWLEAPVELRFVANPFNTNNSFKVAVGAKVGFLVSATTKGKNLQTAGGTTIYGDKYIVKEKEKSYFNSTRFAATMRVGYGPFSLYGAYSILNLFKDGAGPAVKPYSIGLTISGL
ncbi:MAG TPA: outer membrane beta-barrel protein [Phnomibacter sp.]|nr:outer membrane beta-barrel protein [Phnomibacter sp.]